jgi:hypothetical protein
MYTQFPAVAIFFPAQEKPGPMLFEILHCPSVSLIREPGVKITPASFLDAGLTSSSVASPFELRVTLAGQDLQS